jgi:hypothetical protein
MNSSFFYCMTKFSTIKSIICFSYKLLHLIETKPHSWKLITKAQLLSKCEQNCLLSFKSGFYDE